MASCARRAFPAKGVWIAALVLAIGGAAEAHKLKVFATAEGATINGYAYFPGGGRARHVKVLVLDPSGKRLGETTTNERGEFSFQARVRCDHKLVVDSGDGHRATYVVEAEELPASLPAPARAAATAQDKPAPQKPPAAPPPIAPTASGRELGSVVGRVVSERLRPLREQLERLEEKRRLQDILGGIGYIVGVVGVAFYFLGVRQRGRKAGPTA